MLCIDLMFDVAPSFVSLLLSLSSFTCCKLHGNAHRMYTHRVGGCHCDCGRSSSQSHFANQPKPVPLVREHFLLSFYIYMQLGFQEQRHESPAERSWANNLLFGQTYHKRVYYCHMTVGDDC